MSWTVERAARAKKLFADGLSASQIADDLRGVTRAAVCGFLFRNGLTRHASGGGSMVRSRPGPKPASSPTPPASGRRLPSHLSANIAANRARPNAPAPTLAPTAMPRRGPQAFGIVTSIKNNLSADAGEFNSDTEATDLPADESSFAVTFEALRRDQCLWPLGDPAKWDAFRFCGAPKADGPYCPRHACIAGAGHGRSARAEERRGRPTEPFAANPVDPFN